MSYLPPKERTAELLACAIKVAAERGYSHVTRAEIAEAAGVSAALVSLRLGTMAALRRLIMRHAVLAANADPAALRVVAQGLADHNPYAQKASDGLKQRALASLCKAG